MGAAIKHCTAGIGIWLWASNDQGGELDIIDRVPSLGPRAAYAKQTIRDKLIEHKHYISKHGQDMPEIRNWKRGRRE